MDALNIPRHDLSGDDLVDIKDVCVNKELPKDKRIAEYIRQIKNPYYFKCGKYTVRARFSENGPSLEECLQRLVAL